MTRCGVIVCATVALFLATLIGFALNHVPSPFARVALRCEAVVVTVRPNLDFAVFRAEGGFVESRSGSRPLELRDGASARLNSAQTVYDVTCQTSSSPAGLHVEGHWRVHDYVRSFTKRWFVKAE